MLTPASNIAILGFGDDCRRIVAALAPRGCALRVFDPRADQTRDGMQLRARIESLGVDVAADAGAALRGARLVVLDGQCAAHLEAPRLADGQTMLDLRTAPHTEEARITGWFESRGAGTGNDQVLLVAGGEAAKLAAALTAIGLRSEPAASDNRPAGTPTCTSASPLDAGIAPPPVVRRGELP